MKSSTIIAGIAAAVKSVLTGGSPFAMSTILYPPNEDGKYVISSESVRLAFTLHAAALTNLWINDKNGVERDIVMGLNRVDDYSNYSANPFLNGIIGQSANHDNVLLISIDSIPTDNLADRKICWSH